jgi:hypothetical protein
LGAGPPFWLHGSRHVWSRHTVVLELHNHGT